MEDKKTPKKTVTIRIDPTIEENYINQLQTIYGKEQRKKSNTIETMLKQFINVPPEKLKNYLETDTPIINLNLEKIQEYKETIQLLYSTIEDKDEEIKEKNNKISQLEQGHKEKLTTEEIRFKEEMNNLSNNHDSEVKRLAKTIDEKDAAILEQKEIIKEQKAIIQLKEEIIQKLNDDKEAAIQDYKKASNENKHIQARLEKALNDIIDLTNEITEYRETMQAVKKMSFFERVTGKYPNKILELPE